MDRTLLNKLTCSGEEMPAGYLYTELVSGTNNLFALVGQSACGTHPPFRRGHTSPAGVSPEDTVVEILDFVSRKLERSDSDPFVKAKCLRLLKHLCERGHERIRGIIQRRYLHRIKACQTYRGPPHPLQGDAPSAAVRAEADACLRCLYAHENGAAAAVSTSIESTGRIEGFGPGSMRATPGAAGGYRVEGQSSSGSNYGAYGGSTPSWSASASSMVGFGNPHFSHEKQPSRREQALQLISSTASKILPTAVQEQLQKVVTTALPGGTTSPASRMQVYSSGSFRPPTAPQYDSNEGSGWTPSTSFSAGYAAAPEDRGRSLYGATAGRYSESAGSYCRPSLDSVSAPAVSSVSSGSRTAVWGPRGASGGAAAADSGLLSPRGERPAVPALIQSGAYENRVVEELLVPCGAKLTPAPATLEDFASKCQALDSRVLGCIIQQKLEDEAVPWISRLRLLCGCEALLRREREKGQRSLAGSTDKSTGESEPPTLAEVLAANCLETVERCMDTPQLKRPATEVLRLLEREKVEEGRPGNRVASATSSGDSNDERETASAVDLLDLGDEKQVETLGAGGRAADESGGDAQDLLDMSGADASRAHAGDAHVLNGIHPAAEKKSSRPSNQDDLLDVLSDDFTTLSVASACPSKNLSAARSQSAPSSASSTAASSFFSGLVVKDDKQRRREGATTARGDSSLLSPTGQAGRSSSASLLPETEAERGGGVRVASAVGSNLLSASNPQEILSLDTVLSSSLAASGPVGVSSGGAPPSFRGASTQDEQARREPVPFPLSRTGAPPPQPEGRGNAGGLAFSPLLLSPVGSQSSSALGVDVSPGPGLKSARDDMRQFAGHGSLFPASLGPLSSALATPASSVRPHSVPAPSFPPASTNLAPPQSRTAHLDRFFSSTGASAGKTRQVASGTTGYAALFPQSQPGNSDMAATTASPQLLHAASVTSPGRTEWASGASHAGGEGGAPFPWMGQQSPGANSVARGAAAFAPLGGPLGPKGPSAPETQPAALGTGGGVESRNAEARTKFAFVTS
ncbi:hypothetical protein TGVEG_301410 [Toxoplasma gondii VEG]|uniref:ENTH domain-containing protein n=2 Tax=Toxoplasma gondii TaxID=5811 RepID=V5AXI1_TOXGV|nr:hypothetical protein TGVEG_301410 [Toxoplasma gondii VEG]KFG28242.1 hypothetical protein TGP89_301410 [Toxoplasma gondii p89]CEL72679.1 TPA: hypothetical protein BN1205_042050 [Toxoplasma gondii VEG]